MSTFKQSQHHEQQPAGVPADGAMPDEAGQPAFPSIPSFDFSSPATVASYDASHGSQLGRSNFFRNAAWSPDGSSLLTVGDDRTMRLFTLPTELLDMTLPTRNLSPSLDLKPTLVLPQQSAIYSSLWYPTASLSTEGTFCFLVAGEGVPIRLMDGVDGRIRASYTIFDHRERFVAPHAMAFNNDASKLYCGFQDAIEIFDLSRPGNGTRQHMSPSKKNKSGQKGIISALAFSPDPSTDTYAAGSFARSLALYSEKTGPKQVLTFRGIDGAGVTSLKFNPYNPSILYSASRRSTCLVQSFDVRFPKKPLETFLLPPGSTDDGEKGTNQRMGFEVDLWGRYLVAGDKTGLVSFFDVSPESNISPEDGSYIDGEKTAGFVLDAGRDAIPSAALHPYLPLLATCSGARHAPSSPPSSDSSSSSESESEFDSDDASEREASASIPLATPAPGAVRGVGVVGTSGQVRMNGSGFRPKEAKLRLWDFTGRPAAEAAVDRAEGREGEDVPSVSEAD